MIVYFDTSALVKRYFDELYTDQIANLWQSSDERVTSGVTFAELMATTHRKIREETIIAKKKRDLIKQIKDDWEVLMRVEINKTLNEA